MEQFAEGESTREEIKNKLRQNFDGKIVRKDLTKKIKEGANVPVYVLEFLLGQYCSSDDETVIEKGVQNVKRILADNFVRPDESQKILSQLRKKGSHTIIDMVTVRLDMKKDCFFAEFSNLGVGNVPIADEYPEKFDRLLCGGIWCIVQLDYEVEGDNNFGIEDIDGNPLRSKQKKQKDISPISIRKLTPIQMPHIDIDELKQGRTAFTKNEWLDILLRSIGMEPDEFTYREKWLLLTRMIPCDSAMNEKTGHDGIFWVHENDIDKYVDIYNPVQLRYDKRTKVNPIPKTMNFGLSKGLTFNRVLIYPTKPMLDWLSGKSKDMKDESLSKFYVAVTRARYSVAFVYKTKRLPTNDIGTKWTPDVL